MELSEKNHGGGTFPYALRRRNYSQKNAKTPPKSPLELYERQPGSKNGERRAKIMAVPTVFLPAGIPMMGGHLSMRRLLLCATPLGLQSGTLHTVLIGQVFSSKPVLCPLNILIPCGDFCLMHDYRSSCSRNGGAYHLSLATTGRNEKTCRSGVWV
jgi:hypothetical protein